MRVTDRGVALAAVALAVALAYNPRLPGPTELVDAIFRPAIVVIEQLSAKRGDQAP